MHPSHLAAAAAALACANACAQAPASVTLYGSLDVAVTRRADHVWAIDPQGGNRLGWFGLEDLGGGWAAQFRMEMRFDPDTGLPERSSRPIWQGETTVGLRSPWGTVRLGRAMTAMQWYAGYFDPWALKTVASINLNQMASYFSDPLQGAGAGSVRWGNAVFYDSPRIAGVLAAASITAPEGQYAVHPYSLALQYDKNGLMLFTGYERNTVGTRFSQVAGGYDCFADWHEANEIDNYCWTGWPFYPSRNVEELIRGHGAQPNVPSGIEGWAPPPERFTIGRARDYARTLSPDARRRMRAALDMVDAEPETPAPDVHADDVEPVP